VQEPTLLHNASENFTGGDNEKPQTQRTVSCLHLLWRSFHFCF